MWDCCGVMSHSQHYGKLNTVRKCQCYPSGETRSRTRGLGTQGPGTLSLVLHCSRYSGLINSMSNLLQAQTNDVLHIVTMHSEGLLIADCYSPISLILRVVYCQSCKARLVNTKQENLHLRWPVDAIMHMTLTLGSYASSLQHAIMKTILGFYRVKKGLKKLVENVK